MNLEQIATELSEMGVTDFWAGMLRYLANEAGYSGEHDVKFEKLSDSIAVSFGECQGEMDAQRVVIEALNQDLSINTYTDGAVFLVPVTVTTLKKPTQQMKTRESSATEGKDMTAEEIGKVLFDSGVNPIACEATVRILIRNGYARAVPDAVVARINGKIDFMFGNHEFAESFSLTENSEELDFVYAISTPSNTGRFVYSVENQKEVEEDIKKREVATMFPNTKASGVDDDHAKVRVILDLDSIATKVTEMVATPFWSDLFRLIATEKGFGNGPQKVVFANYPDSVVVGMGEFADDDYEPEVKRFKALDREMTYTTFSDGIVFQIPTNPEQTNDLPEPIRCSTWSQWTDTIKKETEMYIPKTTIQILKPIYRDRLEKAGLSEEAIRVILDEVFHGKALKAPKEDSSFVILSGKDVLHIYYSHNNKAIGMANIEATKSTQAGEVINYSVGIEDATFIVDTSNTQEKLIHRHLGVPKVKLGLSSGYSVDLPFKKTYEAVTRDQVVVRITCDVTVSLSNKALNNLYGPALVDLTNTEKDRYFVNSQECTEEEVRQKRELWATQGIVNPGAGSWSDIEKA